MASRESNIAPRSDSSASRLWGGTRPLARRRTDSIAWTTVAPASALGVMHPPAEIDPRSARELRSVGHSPCGSLAPKPQFLLGMEARVVPRPGDGGRSARSQVERGGVTLIAELRRPGVPCWRGAPGRVVELGQLWRAF